MGKDLNLATTETVVSTYAGEAAKPYFSAALLSGKTLSSNLVTIEESVKLSIALKTIKVSGIIANRTDNFTPTGTVSVGEKVLTPKELEVNIELKKSKYRASWDALEMGASANDVLPSTFEEYLIGIVGGFVAQSIEQSFWNGVSATAGEFEGVMPVASADVNIPAAQKITAIPILTTNVIGELTKVTANMPDALYDDETVTIKVSTKVHKAFNSALGAFVANADIDKTNVSAYRVGKDLFINGYLVTFVPGLSGDQMFACKSDNLFFATGLMNDQNEIKVLDMSDVTGDDVVRVIMNFTGAAAYNIPEDVVYYGA